MVYSSGENASLNNQHTSYLTNFRCETLLQKGTWHEFSEFTIDLSDEDRVHN